MTGPIDVVQNKDLAETALIMAILRVFGWVGNIQKHQKRVNN